MSFVMHAQLLVYSVSVSGGGAITPEPLLLRSRKSALVTSAFVRLTTGIASVEVSERCLTCAALSRSTSSQKPRNLSPCRLSRGPGRTPFILPERCLLCVSSSSSRIFGYRTQMRRCCADLCAASREVQARSALDALLRAELEEVGDGAA